MSILLDTHFILWIASQSKRLKPYRWLERYLPWTISPISFLEIQFLAEAGRVDVVPAEMIELVKADPRFLIDEVPLTAMVHHAMHLAWTRDPFDRLLAGHSLARQVDFCTVDATILSHHSRLVRELKD